jgi:alanyl-tRNA synthetase
MEYNKTADGRYVKLRQRNVDTGMGIDRTAAVLQGRDDVFSVETLRPLIDHIEQLAGRQYSDNPKPFRVIADHVRASTFAIADGASPSNVEAGYVVRRLVRRAVRYGRDVGIRQSFCADLSNVVVDIFAPAYPELAQNRERIADEIEREETKFKGTLERGLREYQKVTQRMRDKGASALSATDAFDLFETFGFPLPFTVELAREQGLAVDEAGFEALYKAHQEISRRGMEQKFKGGLADHTEETTRLHTATHLLHQALRQVLGPAVRQMGSNITSDRLRFDFSYPDKLTLGQIERVEAIVNEQIAHDLSVSVEVMPSPQALESGALAFFGEKYGDQVKVYSIGAFSKEVCGGPHVTHIGTLGHFKITKQESVGQGVRRVRAILE